MDGQQNVKTINYDATKCQTSVLELILKFPSMSTGGHWFQNNKLFKSSSVFRETPSLVWKTVTAQYRINHILNYGIESKSQRLFLSDSLHSQIAFSFCRLFHDAASISSYMTSMLKLFLNKEQESVFKTPHHGLIEILSFLLDDIIATKFLIQYSRCLKQGPSGYKSWALAIN